MDTKLLFLVGLAIAASASAQTCGSKTDCSSCVATEFCGWCSPVPVVFQNKSETPTQCVDQREKFVCDHLYSTGTCQQGYICDNTVGQCKIAAPGQGDTKENCEKSCAKVQMTKCNWDTHQCESCVAGEPGCSRQNKDDCGKYCHKQPDLYKCDNSTHQCKVCDHAYCSSNADCPGSYCNMAGQGPWTCHSSECQQQYKCQTQCSCNTPTELLGVSRGIQVQSTWSAGSFIWNFEAGLKVSLTNPDGMVSNGVMSCPQNRMFDIKWVSGPLSGETWVGLYTSWQQGAITAEWALAFAPNTTVAAPTSVDDAMFGHGYMVFSVSSCLKDQDCSFSANPAMPLTMSLDQMFGRSLRGLEQDPCNAFDSCSSCINAPSGLCGWCDTPVVYANGAKGYQCAGYDAQGHANPTWTCHVKYRRDSCYNYKCNWSNYSAPTCEALPQGQPGLTKQECALGCKPTEALYQCDNSTFQCTQCDVSYCRSDLDCPNSYCQVDTSKPGPYICHGGIPDGCNTKDKCSSSCIPPEWDGTWRGIQMDTEYQEGEFDWTIYAAKQVVAIRTPTNNIVEASLKLGDQSKVSEGTAIVLTVTKSNQPGIPEGLKLFGLFDILTSDKHSNLKFLQIGGFTTQSSTFAAAQKGRNFFLQACDKARGCNFDLAVVPLSA